MLKNGKYKSEYIGGDVFEQYSATAQVKETKKSYIFKLLNYTGEFKETPIKDMFKNGKKVIIYKKAPQHIIKNWEDNTTFTIYPYNTGKPYFFEKI